MYQGIVIKSWGFGAVAKDIIRTEKLFNTWDSAREAAEELANTLFNINTYCSYEEQVLNVLTGEVEH